MLLCKSFTRAFCSRSPALQKLLTKMPKEVEIDVSPGFLSILFEQSKKSPSYLLLKELFAYLTSTSILTQEFPFIKSEDRFQQNWMALHMQILKARLIEEKHRSQAINELELERYNYNAQTYFFQSYSKHVHPQMPTFSFASHFSEAYLKRYLMFQQTFNEHYEQRQTEEILSGVLRRLVYEGRVGLKDVQLAKLVKYYIAHVLILIRQRRYLSTLTWSDLLHYKVKWGLQEDRGLLQHLSQ